MVDLNMIPKNGQWSVETAQAYFVQQIAKSLETVVRQNNQADRTCELLKAERTSHDITKTALQLMLYKNEIVSLFERNGSVRLSDFRSMLIHNKLKFVEWVSRETLIEAIGKIDYLDYEKTGTGFRVKIIRKEEST